MDTPPDDGRPPPSEVLDPVDQGRGPVESGVPRLRPFEGAAGGLGAVTSALSYAVRTAGVGRSVRSLLRVNQEAGFDCPGCAWPDPDHRSTAEFCENGARAVADEATTARADPELFETHSVAELARQSDVWLNARGRLTHPMLLDGRRGETHYHPISWEEAFGRVGKALGALADPNEAVFYTSGRASNEAAFLYQLLARHLGTNNLPDCSNLCHESSGVGLTRTIGIGKGTVLLSDFERADAIFVIGQNPGTNHPRMLSALRSAKRRGCKIVGINPIKEAALRAFAHPQKVGDLIRPVSICDLYLQVRVGGDVAVLKGIAKTLLELDRERGNVLDRRFIERSTAGFEAFERDIDACSWDEITRGSGLPRSQIESAGHIAADAKATIACWAMGITQHVNGVANVQSIVNVLLLQGNLGRPGAGVCPVRGHSNVQGDRTMGIWEKSPPWFAHLARDLALSAELPPGYAAVEAIEAMHAGRVRVFVSLGGNFLSATPDTDYTAVGLSRCDLTVHVSTKLNRAHLVPGRTSLILPCLGRTERDVQGDVLQFVTVENSMGIVHGSRGRLAPASPHLLSEPRIVAELAHATFGTASRLDWRGLASDYRAIRDLIGRYVPGFEDFDRRVADPGGFVLPNGPRERRFTTPSGKAHFTVHPIAELELPEGRLWLTTVRAHDQFNTTIYEPNDRYRGIYDHRRVILLHPDDIEALGLAARRRVTVTSHFRGETRTAPGFTVVPYDIPAGSAAAYFPEANVLVPWNSFAEHSKTPTSKRIAISLALE